MKSFIFLNICNELNVIKTIHFIGYIISIVKILVPVLLIIISGYNLFQTLFNNEDKNKEIIVNIFKKFFIAATIFFIPTIISLFTNLLNNYESFEENFSTCTTCLLSPNNCQSIIENINRMNTSKEELELQEIENMRNQTYNQAKKEEADAITSLSKKPEANSSNENNPDLNISTGKITLDWKDVTKISNMTQTEFSKALSSKNNKYHKKAVRFEPYVAAILTEERKHSVNAFYLISIYALESGWVDSTATRKCNNLGGVKYSSGQKYANGTKKTYNCMKTGDTGHYAGFDSVASFIDYHATLLHKHYLTPGGKYYNGKTPEGVVIRYCPGGGSTYVKTIKQIGNAMYAGATK